MNNLIQTFTDALHIGAAASTGYLIAQPIFYILLIVFLVGFVAGVIGATIFNIKHNRENREFWQEVRTNMRRNGHNVRV